MSDSKSTLDDEVDDEPAPDSRETCWFWESHHETCHFESLIPGSEPCADCPASAGDDPRHIAISVYGWNCDVCGRLNREAMRKALEAALNGGGATS